MELYGFMEREKKIPSYFFIITNYAPFNIFNELNNNYMDLNVHDFRIQTSIDYKPITKLKLTALVAVKSAASTMEHVVRENSNQALAYRAMGTTTGSVLKSSCKSILLST